MKRDIVSELLRQWAVEHPDMDTAALGIAVRIQMLGKLLHGRATRALAVHGLKHWEYDVLSVLRRQGEPYEMAATELAREALLTSGAMTTRIDGLEKRGFLHRRQNRLDGRSVIVRLTPKGLQIVNDAIHTRLEDANHSLAVFPSEERKQLAELLERLNVHIEN